MPVISRAFIKSGMVFFALSLMLGIALQIDSLPLPALIPLFWHCLMLGWITQIIMGVSLWMFPNRKKEEHFKALLPEWTAFYGLNVGLVLRIVAEPFVYSSQLGAFKVALVVSAIMQLLAVAGYIFALWPRILSKEKSIALRKRKRNASN